MSKITDSAKGKDCLILLPGYPHMPETVVHCHYPMAGITSGTGYKSADLLGARGCYDCHRVVDNRDLTADERTIPREWVKERFREGVIRTIGQLIREGVLK